MLLKPKKINLGGISSYRVCIVSKETGEEKFEIGQERIQFGFGLTRENALEDFIRRNSFLIMESIYLETEVKDGEEI